MYVHGFSRAFDKVRIFETILFDYIIRDGVKVIVFESSINKGHEYVVPKLNNDGRRENTSRIHLYRVIVFIVKYWRDLTRIISIN